MAKKPIEKLKSIFSNILVVIVFIGAFLLVKEFKSEWYNSKSNEDASISVANKTAREIQHAQSQSTSEISATEILVEKAHENVKNTLDSTIGNKDKLVAASNMFFGAYFLNTRTRLDYCSNLGVDISSFVNEYKQVNRKLFVSAEKLQVMDYKEHNRTYDIDKLYNLVKKSNKELIKQDMQDTASYLKLTEAEVCRTFKQLPVEWAKETDLRKRAPELAQLLLK